MQRVCGIYLLRNVVNGKVYVGQSVDCHMRLKQHIKESKRNRSFSHLYQAMRKHGYASFSMELLETLDAPSQAHIDERERHWIKELDVCNPEAGYNFRPGGQHDQVVDAEARARISAKLKGRKQSPEMREKNRISHIGIPCTEEAKKKMAAFHTGIVLDKETAEQIRVQVRAEIAHILPPKTKTGTWVMPQEMRDQVSARFKGKPKSEETRRRISEARQNRDKSLDPARHAVSIAITKARWAKYREDKAKEAA